MVARDQVGSRITAKGQGEFSWGTVHDLVHPLERRAFSSLSGLSLVQACLKTGGRLLGRLFQREQGSREGEWLL